MSHKILQGLAKIFTTKIPKPWDKIFLTLLAVILAVPLFFLLTTLLLSTCIFILDHSLYGLKIDLLGFLVFPFITIISLLVYHFLSKERSVSKFFRLCTIFIFSEVIIYIWLNAWSWDRLISTEGDEKGIFIITNRLEIIITYIKALFKTIAISLVLIVGYLFSKQKYADK